MTESGECPMCKSYMTYVVNHDGSTTCFVCNTSWGGGNASNKLGPTWLPGRPLR